MTRPKRDAVRRLAGKVRRARPNGGANAPSPSAPESAKPLTPAEAAARIDAARDRLRARIEPPDPERD
ncbi:MAG TPA: hypothetical protein VHZ75_08145 [Solirubrobacteraceae bacterium]|nr:hypothetical protein [Solirubrobacteraceae bacterium]